tara:strand:- start:1325 stop:2269 length:945 start_codon:yes stop_codon:yes gene_type:complete
MAAFGTYYIDSSTFATATGVYIDASLTTAAPDGYYSDGVIYRLQTSGLLSRNITCPDCNPPCGGAISGTGTQGVYYINYDVGNSIGAVIITLTPAGTFRPVGISTIYDGQSYNEFSSVNDGYLAGTPVNAPTYVGDTAADCGIAGVLHTIDEYDYNVATGLFTATGTQLSFGVTASQVQTTTGTPGACVMVIPKLNISPTIIAVSIFAPCASTNWTIAATCPTALTSFQCSSLPFANSTLACADTPEIVCYNAPVTGVAGSPDINDWIFTDPNGNNKLSNAGGAGYYKWDDGSASGAWFEIDGNSVVISTGSCP